MTFTEQVSIQTDGPDHAVQAVQHDHNYNNRPTETGMLVIFIITPFFWLTLNYLNSFSFALRNLCGLSYTCALSI